MTAGHPAGASGSRRDLFEIYLTCIRRECGPIDADLNSHRLNADAKAKKIVPAEELRLNMAVPPTAEPNRLGVLAGDLAGFPNGRRLADDVLDISLQAVEGAAQTGELVPELADGDLVDTNDVPFEESFPYLALPFAGPGDAPGGTASQAGHATDAARLEAPVQMASLGMAGLGALLLGTGGFRIMRHRGKRD